MIYQMSDCPQEELIAPNGPLTPIDTDHYELGDPALEYAELCETREYVEC